MEFTTLTTTATPLRMDNVDTDQIIPARFLKATERKGFGDNLFRDWRYDKANQPIADFDTIAIKQAGWSDILDAADGIMVARGDLGVEMDLAEVALLQKKIIKINKRLFKDVYFQTIYVYPFKPERAILSVNCFCVKKYKCRCSDNVTI